MSHDEVLSGGGEDEPRSYGWLLIVGGAAVVAGVSLLGGHTKSSAGSLLPPPATTSPPSVTPSSAPSVNPSAEPSASHPAGQLMADLPSATAPANPSAAVLAQAAGFTAVTTICPVVTDRRTTLTVTFILRNPTPVDEEIVRISPVLAKGGLRATSVGVQFGDCKVQTSTPVPPARLVLKPADETVVTLNFALPKKCPARYPVGAEVTVTIDGHQRSDDLPLYTDLGSAETDLCKRAG